MQKLSSILPPRTIGSCRKPLCQEEILCLAIASLIAITTTIAFVMLCTPLLAATPQGSDPGRYGSAANDFKSWIEGLSCHDNIPCCPYADAITPEKVSRDMGTHRYQIQIGGNWVPVPEVAVINGPNPFGRAVVWLEFHGLTGDAHVVCFLPSPPDAMLRLFPAATLLLEDQVMMLISRPDVHWETE